MPTITGIGNSATARAIFSESNQARSVLDPPPRQINTTSNWSSLFRNQSSPFSTDGSVDLP